MRGYLHTLVSVANVAAKAYHAERLAFRVLKDTARSRAQFFWRVFSPKITEEPSRIVDEAVKKAELALLGWTKEEADIAEGQASFSFETGSRFRQELRDNGLRRKCIPRVCFTKKWQWPLKRKRVQNQNGNSWTATPKWICSFRNTAYPPFPNFTELNDKLAGPNFKNMKNFSRTYELQKICMRCSKHTN